MCPVEDLNCGTRRETAFLLVLEEGRRWIVY